MIQSHLLTWLVVGWCSLLPTSALFPVSYNDKPLLGYGTLNSIEGPVDARLDRLTRLIIASAVLSRQLNFRYNSTTIESYYNQDLDQIAKLTLEFPEIRLSLEGHTDLAGTSQYNQELGAARAKSLHEALLLRGVSKERMRCVSHGESFPLVYTEGKASVNRRVEIVVHWDVP